MTFPVRGVIERRILVNYRVDPALLRLALPAPFRPRVMNGWGMAGICLIRLGQMRRAGVPGRVGPEARRSAAARRALIPRGDRAAVRPVALTDVRAPR